MPKFLCVAATGILLALPAASMAAVEPVLTLPSGDSPEGIAVGRTGTLYVSNRRVDGGQVVSEILRVSVEGDVSRLTTLASHPSFVSGVLGLAIDRHGTVYAALVTFDPATHGVWRVNPDGSGLARLPGSEQMVFPNALVFDSHGNLYVTDSFGGSVWRFTRNGVGAEWIQDELLQPLPFDPFGIQLPGANGIAFDPPNHLYVANTERGLIAHIAIDLQDGSAAEPATVAQGLELLTVDGLAVDVTGDVYAAVPGYSVFGVSPLVRVDPVSGDTAPTVSPGDFGRFDVPLSLAFGAGARSHRSAFVTNGDLPVIPGGPGPGVVEVGLGVPG
jgi:hypothetical protein